MLPLLFLRPRTVRARVVKIPLGAGAIINNSLLIQHFSLVIKKIILGPRPGLEIEIQIQVYARY